MMGMLYILVHRFSWSSSCASLATIFSWSFISEAMTDYDLDHDHLEEMRTRLQRLVIAGGLAYAFGMKPYFRFFGAYAHSHLHNLKCKE